MNPLGSYFIPGADDGFVSIRSTQLTGMSDFHLADLNHTFLLLNADIADQVQHFLEVGQFF